MRAAARGEFASFFPDEVSALEEPAAVEMAKKARQVSVAVPGRDKPVMTSCVSSPAPKGAKMYLHSSSYTASTARASNTAACSRC